MYTKILNVQIIVSLLKQHGIRHLVLSAGTRHVPLAHSVENDDFFTCYSVVDERSAGYFALGLAKELGQPVAIACTSSTATCNYLPPIAEAFYQQVPLLVLTGDRDPILLDQLEDQMINQVDMYKNFCRKCVSLPVVNSDSDIWYCQRLVNEAILELNHHGSGPVQINFPINQSIEDIADASVPELPMYNMIRRVDPQSPEAVWQPYVEKLKQARRILVVCGSGSPLSASAQEAMSDFAAKYNCLFSVENLSNVHCKGSLNTFLLAEAYSDKLLGVADPDLVLYFGGNFVSRLKVQLRGRKGNFESWLISPQGRVMDPFQNQTMIFECTPEYFFRYCAGQAGGRVSDSLYYHEVKERIGKMKLPDMGALALPQDICTPAKDAHLSNVYAIYQLSRVLPQNSLVHLSILNSTRLMSMFEIDPSIAVYSNIGTDGIDGSMSTFFGQMTATQREGFLVIGDLSFFYDMNSVGIRNLGKNIHILLINNGGGAEFYFSMGRKRLPNIDCHISAQHSHHAREWVKANGFAYLEADTRADVDSRMQEFVNTPGPVLLEVFTHRESDAESIKALRRAIHVTTATEAVKQTGKALLEKAPVSKEFEDQLKRVLKKIF